MLHTGIRRGLSDKRGSTSLIFGIASLVLVGAVGGAIDYNRYAAARRATQAAVDAAVLAGARALLLDPDNTAAAVSIATNFYSQNVLGRSTLASDTITFTVADSNTAITATGSAYIATSFLRVMGIEQLLVMSDAGAGFPKAKISGGGGSNIEVSVMLDVTGSMCNYSVSSCSSGTKIDAMKTAAKELVDIVVRADQSNHYSKVALVPFATRVRVGPDGGGGAVMTAMTGLGDTWTGWYNMCTDGSGEDGNEGQGNWSCNSVEAQHQENWQIMPCVTDRYYNSSSSYDYTDNAPGAGQWLNAHDGGRMPESWDSSDTPAGSQTGQNPGDAASHWNYSFDGECADVHANNEIVPLSSDKTALKAKIDSLVAYGSTAGALGTAFSWYMLSPNWATVWGGTSAPGSYADLTTQQASGAPVLRKVAILMTDGVYNTYRGWKGQNQQAMSDHAKQLCTNMKAAGIEVYTIGFALDELGTSERAIAEDTLQSCGSSIEHFYNSLTPADLTAAFQDIGIKLTSIALSK